MLRMRLALSLAVLSVVALSSSAAAIGEGLPVSTDGLPGVPAVPAAPALPALPGARDAAAADPVLAEVHALLAQAQEQARVAARNAHAADSAKLRMERILAHAAAKGSADASDTAAAPDQAPGRALARLQFFVDQATVESESSRADAFAFVDQARALMTQRAATLASTDPASVPPALQALLATRAADAQARAGELASTDPALVLALAQKAVANAQARVEAAQSADAQQSAQLLLARAQSRLDHLQARADAFAARAETDTHATIDAPDQAPFRLLERARAEADGRARPVLASG